METAFTTSELTMRPKGGEVKPIARAAAPRELMKVLDQHHAACRAAANACQAAVRRPGERKQFVAIEPGEARCRPAAGWLAPDIACAAGVHDIVEGLPV